MSRYAIIPAIALSDTRLTIRDISVLCVLGTYADKRGFCYPSVTTIGGLLGITRQAVQKPINRLIELGYIDKQDRFIPGTGQTSNMYRVLMDYVPPDEFLQESAREVQPPVAGGVQPPVAGGVQPPVAGGVQPPVAGGATPEVAGGATPEVAGGATPEVALTSQINVPMNVPERGGATTEIISQVATQRSASLIPDNYHPPDTIIAQLHRAGKSNVDPYDKTLLAKFVSHNQGIGALSPDWDAKYFNWCLREKSGGKIETNQRTHKPSLGERASQARKQFEQSSQTE